jgi:hypothetical protein
MVRIRFTARPRTPVVSSKFESMASVKTPEISVQCKEASIEQHESLEDQQRPRRRLLHHLIQNPIARANPVILETVKLPPTALSTWRLSRWLLWLGSAMTLVSRISQKFRIGSMESYTRYFPKGYGQPPDAESVSEPRANKAVIFEDFFAIGLRMPPHLVLVDILCKFHM